MPGRDLGDEGMRHMSMWGKWLRNGIRVGEDFAQTWLLTTFSKFLSLREARQKNPGVW